MNACGFFSHIPQKACPRRQAFLHANRAKPQAAAYKQALPAHTACACSHTYSAHTHSSARLYCAQTYSTCTYYSARKLCPCMPFTRIPLARIYSCLHASGLWRQYRKQPCRKKFADTGCPVQGFPYLRYGWRKLRRHAALACKAPCWQAHACLLPATPDVAL